MPDRIDGIHAMAVTWLSKALIPLDAVIMADVLQAVRVGLVTGRGPSLAKKMARAYLRLLSNRMDEQLEAQINKLDSSDSASGDAANAVASGKPQSGSAADGSVQPTQPKRGSKAS